MIIDAQEGRAVHTFDVPEAYLHADLPKEKRVLLKLTGEFVDIMCKVKKDYSTYVRFQNGKKVLYLRVLKAIYGMIESALLWYELVKWVLKLTHATSASPTRSLKVLNVPSVGTLTTIKCHT
jgi:hypothetical protein